MKILYFLFSHHDTSINYDKKVRKIHNFKYYGTRRFEVTPLVGREVEIRKNVQIGRNCIANPQGGFVSHPLREPQRIAPSPYFERMQSSGHPDRVTERDPQGEKPIVFSQTSLRQFENKVDCLLVYT